MGERLMDGIKRRLRERYGSLDSPDFSFVRDALAVDPYAPVVCRIKERFTCEGDTDPNDDVSFGYVLRSAEGTWVLRLSMVGPYAVLLREGRDGALEVVSPSASDISDPERYLTNLLAEAGLIVVDRDTLDQAIPLKLSNAEPGQVRLYQALFTDTAMLPWERQVVRG